MLDRLGLGADLDLPRLEGLGHLADEVDLEQAVDQPRAVDTDVVGELEAALEGAAGDAAVQIAARVGLFLELAGDQRAGSPWP